MFEKFKDWYYLNDEIIEFWAMMTTIGFIAYCVVYAINWALIAFLDFTYLKVLVGAWIGFSCGLTAVTVYEDWKAAKRARRNQPEQSNEHRLL